MKNKFFDQFRGLNKDIWILSITTFLNKFGTMVIPFLTIYLKTGLKFSYYQIDYIMFYFGLGSICGNYLSGKIAERIGNYKTMVISLTGTGIMFLVLKNITDFYAVCALIFLLTCISDLFRPAMLAFIKSNTHSYSSAKGLALYRTADSLGFFFGPTIGGLLLLYNSYDILFIFDGVSCLVAIGFFAYMIKERKIPYKLKKTNPEYNPISIFSDRPYILHLLITLITGILFFQIFITLPFYDKEVLGLPHYYNGLFLSSYALLLLIFEFPIVTYIEKIKTSKIIIITYGLLSMTLAFTCLLLNNRIGLILMLIFISFGVILTYPFAISFAMARSNKYQVAKYMSIITISYSIARVVSSKIGMTMIANYGFEANWAFMISLGLTGILLSFWLNNIINKEAKRKKEAIINSIFKSS